MATIGASAGGGACSAAALRRFDRHAERRRQVAGAPRRGLRAQPVADRRGGEEVVARRAGLQHRIVADRVGRAREAHERRGVLEQPVEGVLLFGVEVGRDHLGDDGGQRRQRVDVATERARAHLLPRQRAVDEAAAAEFEAGGEDLEQEAEVADDLGLRAAERQAQCEVASDLGRALAKQVGGGGAVDHGRLGSTARLGDCVRSSPWAEGLR